MSICFIIPAYKPTQDLIGVVQQLKIRPDTHVIIVDDGNTDRTFFHNKVFTDVTLLHHAINRGKGAALKTGYDYALTHFSELTGCITLDADGQHRVDDVLKVLDQGRQNPNALVLGVRDFNQKGIPLRSSFGNKVSAGIWRILTGFALQDTQTGLRYIPKDFGVKCLLIEADRYEFETEMLLLAHQEKVDIHQVPIKTVYLENNASSHFNPIFDSLKIYFALFRFAISGLVCTGVDYLIYSVLIYTYGLPAATSFTAARMVSLGLNFHLNRSKVFNAQSEKGQFLKYLLLSAINMFIGYGLLTYVTWTVSHVAAKLIIDLLLFVLNFFIQKEFIFKRNTRPISE